MRSNDRSLPANSTIHAVRSRFLAIGFCAVLAAIALHGSAAESTTATEQNVPIRFLDSATGCAVQPDSVSTRSQSPGVEEFRPSGSEFSAAGHGTLKLQRGRHTVLASASRYQPMSGDVEVSDSGPYVIQFLLDPVETPEELRPETIAALQRDGATLLQGFISDDATGAPIPGVTVHSEPSGSTTTSDERGFFRLYVPVSVKSAPTSAAKLVFEKPGYQTLERQNLELWTRGDWTYKIQLQPGKGLSVVDENLTRHRSGSYSQILPTPAAVSQFDEVVPASPTIKPLATQATNSTIRVPRNIRVLRSDGVTIDYVTMNYYARAVLPSEWIASWGSASYPGGTNSLNAGAVAARCYAIVKLNNVSGTSTYDICATTSCQVYNPANFNSLTDTAVNYTENWVVISGGAIANTEYSAEDNSLGSACGDGFTAPTGGCLFDPVCAGEARNGHGRGMCQWGTAKWASGRKFTGNSTGNSTLNGYPRRDWKWIVQHYYPTLTLVKGAPLLIGDDVKAFASVNINQCADGSISNGINCPLLATLPANTTGVILAGPTVVTNDGKGFTWYQVQWNDASSTLGWVKENFIERVFSTPTAPSGLTAAAAGTNQINLGWTDNAGVVAAGFRIERAIASGGPWLEINTVATGVTNYSDTKLYPASTWFYRVRAYNAGGNSGYSATASVTTSNPPPILPAIANRTIVEGTQLTFTNTASGPDFVQLLTDFEPFVSETANGVVMFRDPTNSATTTAFMSPAPDLAAIADAFPTNGNTSARVLRVNCNFTNPSNPWLRLTTASATTFPNPVINFAAQLRFKIYSDKAIQVAVGCRETTTAAGSAIGSNGGTTGAIEWAGVTNVSGTAPMPTRSLSASNWATLTFNFTNEPIRSFSSGNGVLSTASGLGTLEHLAIVPTGGTGAYNIYLDDLAVVTPRKFTYSLAAGAPGNASIGAATGIFSWSPSEAQGPSTNTISVIVTDNSSPARSTTNTFIVVVNETNSAPVLAAIPDRTVHAGTLVTFTNSTTDSDLPANPLSYSLDPGAPATASVDSITGVFNWLTADANAGNAYPITVRVTDNGIPPLSDTRTFSVAVEPRPTFQAPIASGSGIVLNWSTIPGSPYTVQYKDEILADWTNLLSLTATSSSASITNSPATPQRYFRILAN